MERLHFIKDSPQFLTSPPKYTSKDTVRTVHGPFFLFQLERNVKIRGFSSLCAYPLFSVMRYLLYF